MWWFCSLAVARPLLLETTTGAHVEVLPRTRSEVIEVAVYDNRAYLRRQVATWRAPGLWNARLDDVGGGVEFVMLHLRDPDLVASVVEVSPVAWEVRLTRGWWSSPRWVRCCRWTSCSRGHPAVPPRRPSAPCFPSSATRGATARPHDHPARNPRSRRPRSNTARSSVSRSSRHGTRSSGSGRCCRAPPRPNVLSELFRRLGDAHAGIRMPREAIYYYGQAEAVGQPSASALLARADAAFRIRDWGPPARRVPRPRRPTRPGGGAALPRGPVAGDRKPGAGGDRPRARGGRDPRSVAVPRG